ncbi:aspartate kinase [Bergeyella zoohelcum]|uniref:Aspartokinase n=1 Tax=Bergeyella zoohelcum TaxID=1015 RepID=A0A7Z8YMX0_9FLAO|nr:aspartate kinase [Bergeyella zoohelcum]VDH02832.1 Aspartokinase [Bergeyella zoohelcum]
MRVFKFGGASVRDAHAVRNLKKVLTTQGMVSGVLVISAMGKTTNALEKVVDAYFENVDWQVWLADVFENHKNIIQELLPNDESLLLAIEQLFLEVQFFLERNKSPHRPFVYDQVVSLGELVSTTIISYFLNAEGITNEWLDVRECIKTNAQYQEGIVDWQETQRRIEQINNNTLFVTQGFIGSDEHGFTTTLGREGSDYSAAIFAYGLSAESMTIWKDVPGVMTADPRYFPEAKLITEMTYEEAIEMAYFGASVIHPKTLQPLKQKNIPFFVKSFLYPELEGTSVKSRVETKMPESFILKQNQQLLSISSKDFSFIAENHLSVIFNLLSAKRIKFSLLQNSAISLMLCVEDKFHHLPELLEELAPDFRVHCQENLHLLTIRNIAIEDIARYKEGKNIYLEQMTHNTLQLVYAPQSNI